MAENPQLDHSYIERLPALIEVFQSLANFSNLDDLLKFVISSVTRLIQAERTTLFLADHHSNELYSTIAEGNDGKEIRFPIGIGIAGTVAKDKVNILIPDAYADSRFNPAFDKQSGFRTRNILCMPMQNIEGKVIGVIQVLNKVDGNFSGSDQLLLSSFCTHAAVCIESTLLFCKMEEIVARRTEELSLALQANRVILENIKDGFLVIDKNAIIQAGYSRSCETLLHETSLPGINLFSFAFEAFSEVEQSSIRQLPQWIQYGFDNPSMEQWEELSGLKLRLGDRILQIAFQRLYDGKAVSSIMALISDITQQVELEREIQRQSEESQNALIAVTSMVAHGREGFERFMHQLSDGILGLQTQLVHSSFPDIDECFRILHTQKSLSQTFGLNHLSQRLHQEEDRFALARSRQSMTEEQLLGARENLQELLDEESRLRALFEKIFPQSQSSGIHISTCEWDHLIRHVPAPVANYLLQYQSETAPYLGKMLSREADKVAGSLGKKVSFRCECQNLSFQPELFDLLLNCCLHLVRNAIDHGLEGPSNRLATGKKEFGTLLFQVEDQDGTCVIRLRDDGQGIDLAKVYQIAVKRGLIANHAVLTEAQTLCLLFQPGFSTKEHATMVSGRGVGLDFVSDCVRKLGGSLNIATCEFQGTCFEIRFPLQ